ncbi:hypothetical protein EYF80_019012 [Liparis tanakae]|uniref:Uncharacterized protein n=1 Tax=Liparis tanakae TaxID=230148 RepID=A0A4Z2HY10_9TELE|nr:hypothetical protein EYF80_019012 [Liparis tanakae]
MSLHWRRDGPLDRTEPPHPPGRMMSKEKLAGRTRRLFSLLSHTVPRSCKRSSLKGAMKKIIVGSLADNSLAVTQIALMLSLGSAQRRRAGAGLSQTAGDNDVLKRSSSMTPPAVYLVAPWASLQSQSKQTSNLLIASHHANCWLWKEVLRPSRPHIPKSYTSNEQRDET